MNITSEQQKRIGYLQDIVNKYGDIRVAFLKRKENGEIIHSKWRSVMECWESEEGLYFLSIANNREPLCNEIFIDIDEEIEGETREQTFNRICDFIEKDELKYIGYKSGSKGYHIHIYYTNLGRMNKTEREMIRESFLKLVYKQGDKLKYSDHAMLALENCPHWKTGINKERVRGNWQIL